MAQLPVPTLGSQASAASAGFGSAGFGSAGFGFGSGCLVPGVPKSKGKQWTLACPCSILGIYDHLNGVHVGHMGSCRFISSTILQLMAVRTLTRL